MLSGELSADFEKLTESGDLDRDLEPERGTSGSDNDVDSDKSDCVPPQTKRVCEPECGDVANYRDKSQQLSDADRYQLLVNHFRPSAIYKFPKSANGRSFQYSWLLRYPWLCYSQQKNSGLCFPCVLFASGIYHGSDPGILMCRPLTSFGKALELFHKHAAMCHHKFTVVRADDFKKVMENQQPAIQQQISKRMADTVALNGQKLASILKVIVLCGRQNIALRGHHDNITNLEDTLSTENHGNFWALLSF